MAGRGRLYYQFNRNRDGSLKEEDQLKAKLIDSFYVADSEEFRNDVPQKTYLFDYEFSDGTEVRMIFHADAIGLNFNNEAFILTPDLISNLIAMQKNNGR
jgi:hypothetical protein